MGSRSDATYEYESVIPSGDVHRDHQRMRRISLTTLWFFAGWVIGAVTAFALGLPELVAPVSAVAASLIAYRPGRLERRLRPRPESVPSH